ncbi:unnamed protein product [Sphagnum troendelagicum]
MTMISGINRILEAYRSGTANRIDSLPKLTADRKLQQLQKQRKCPNRMLLQRDSILRLTADLNERKCRIRALAWTPAGIR